MSSFFTTPTSQRKRKRNDASAIPTSKKRNTAGNKDESSKRAKAVRDESISGSSSESEDIPGGGKSEDEEGSSESEHEDETAAERRLRLAEQYLENIRGEVDETGFDAEQIDKDLIAERLKEDVAESKGQLYRHIASDLSFDSASHALFRADTLSTTSIAACPPYVYTVSKDMTLIKWELPPPPSENLPRSGNADTSRPSHASRRRPKQLKFVRGNRHPPNPATYKGHTSQILSVAASSDGKYVVTGGLDRRLIMWDASDLTPLKVFTQHRDAITALAFHRSTNTLFSASRDRTIKTWSLNELAYVETLFGHQDEVVDVASLGGQERCISVGARDRTARLWKVVEETQLVFRGGSNLTRLPSSLAPDGKATSYAAHSIDCLACIDTTTFVTGSSAGSLSLWQISKKKPVYTLPLAHGLDPPPSLADSFAGADPPPLEDPLVPAQPRWITALAAVPYSDLVLSGSWDGWVRAWKVGSDKRRLEPMGRVGRIPLPDSDVVLPSPPNSDSSAPALSKPLGQPPVRGVINSLYAFPLSDLQRPAASTTIGGPQPRSQEPGGVVIVAAVGAEHKFGRWMPKMKGWRNGAVVFTVMEKSKKPQEESYVPGEEGEETEEVAVEGDEEDKVAEDRAQKEGGEGEKGVNNSNSSDGEGGVP
ncbi:MAG: pre-rRNA processing protein [Sclerophora amabilis]|nr:MAG: pre-rRNA processing protein [Sclerophora amabilis]